MKLPSLLPAIDSALADGNAVVVQLVSTAEAMLDRRLADLSDEEREALEIDLSPREYVIDYLTKSFPVRLMAVFIDENGNPHSEPMLDEAGAPVLCRSALDTRDRMIEQLCALPPIATALDAIIERFGVEQVAEVTGRTRRLIVERDGRQLLQSRSPRVNVAETQAFMDGTSKSSSSPMPEEPGAVTMRTLPPRTRRAASISCLSRVGAPTPRSRGSGARIAPIRLQRRYSALSLPMCAVSAGSSRRSPGGSTVSAR